ncbi:MAG TPA: hypothetical protein VF528_07400 [Pyrinomonadaceae bacterium]|jgi:hypothetical protein
MKAYIISFYQQEISDDELVAFLKTRKEVLNLIRPLPSTMFIVSDQNANSLSVLIERKFPKGYFIVAEYIPYNSDGLLSGETWNFLNKPKRARKASKSAGKKSSVKKSKTSSKGK